MKISLFDTVVLERDLPMHGLRCGDLGAVVEVHEPESVEVEFLRGSGKTQAVVTLKAWEVRPIGDREVLAVRPLDAA